MYYVCGKAVNHVQTHTNYVNSSPMDSVVFFFSSSLLFTSLHVLERNTKGITSNESPCPCFCTRARVRTVIVPAAADAGHRVKFDLEKSNYVTHTAQCKAWGVGRNGTIEWARSVAEELCIWRLCRHSNPAEANTRGGWSQRSTRPIHIYIYIVECEAEQAHQKKCLKADGFPFALFTQFRLTRFGWGVHTNEII